MENCLADVGLFWAGHWDGLHNLPFLSPSQLNHLRHSSARYSRRRVKGPCRTVTSTANTVIVGKS